MTVSRVNQVQGSSGEEPVSQARTVDESSPTGAAARSARQPASSSTGSSDAFQASEEDDDGASSTAATTAFDFKAEHEALDRDGDGDVTRQDLRLDEEAFAQKDADGDGRLSQREFRADFHRENSFECLDGDGDGSLSAEEMRELQRFDSRTYDRNQDGSVDSSEFVAARKAEMRGARRERIEERLDGLEGDDLDRMVEKFDADGDGKLTTSEVLAGRREARDSKRTDRADQMFEALAGDGDGIPVEGNKQYRKYDANGDGTVSRAEFCDGQAADYQALRDDRFLNGAPNPDARKRLGIDAAGRPIPTASSHPVDVGSLEDLTWEKAADIIRSQGGELFENGQPTVLAVRTANTGTQAYEDVFVVLKPNGEMQTFAASTRPGFTQDNGSWSPGMVVPGNYRLTPRPADGKWTDAFYINTSGGDMTVPTAKDTDGDGRYSQAEIANSVGDNEIRLHRGNATSTSSAGCFNVQDYDAFLAFLGGHDVSFNLTLVEG